MKILFVLNFLIFGCVQVNELNELQATLEVNIKLKLLCGNVQSGNISTNPCGYSDEKMDEIYGEYSVEIVSKEKKISPKTIKLKKAGKVIELLPFGEYIITLKHSKNNNGIIGEKLIKIIGAEKMVVDFEINKAMQ